MQGTAFHVGIATQYGKSLIDAALHDEHGNPVAVRELSWKRTRCVPEGARGG